MKKEVTIVPKDKCPLDVLAKLESRTRDAWIYLHENAVKKLEGTADRYEELARGIRLTWISAEEYPKTVIFIGVNEIGRWKPVYSIKAEDIAFEYRAGDPEEILFIKMDE